MAEYTIFYMNGQKETIPGDMNETQAQGFFGCPPEVILRQDNLTFLARNDHDHQPPNPSHPVIGGPVVMITDSEEW